MCQWDTLNWVESSCSAQRYGGSQALYDGIRNVDRPGVSGSRRHQQRDAIKDSNNWMRVWPSHEELHDGWSMHGISILIRSPVTGWVWLALPELLESTHEQMGQRVNHRTPLTTSTPQVWQPLISCVTPLIDVSSHQTIFNEWKFYKNKTANMTCCTSSVQSTQR